MAFTKFPGFSVDWTTKATKISGQASNFKTWLNTRTAELQDYIDNVLLGEIDTALGGKSDTTHNHDTSYAPASHLAEDASLTAKGHVQLSDSVSTTSSSLAATSTAVKSAYDKGNHSHPYEGTLNADQKRKITISTSDPSGGSDGDIWMKYV